MARTITCVVGDDFIGREEGGSVEAEGAERFVVGEDDVAAAIEVGVLLKVGVVAVQQTQSAAAVERRLGAVAGGEPDVLTSGAGESEGRVGGGGGDHW